MKKIFLSLLLCLFAVSSFAQFNVYARMWDVYGGVKKIVIETSGEVLLFDREGRLTSNTMGTDEFRYSWNGNKITVSAYQNGKKLGDDYMTVTRNTAREISISLPNGTITETYHANGRWEKIVFSSNEGSIVESSFYHSDSDKSPYKFTSSINGQVETFEIHGVQYDAKGNWVKRTLRLNGESETEIRTITYYN